MTQHPSLRDLMDLTGRTALVTGGAMGIGQAIVRRLAEAGASVAVCDTDLEVAQQVCKDLADHDLEVRPIRCDVAVEDDVENAVDQTMAWTGRLDILVNDAGIYPARPVLGMSSADFDRVLDVNLRGTFLTCRSAAEVMVAQGQGGSIVNITSIDAVHPSSVGLAHYDASKHGVWGFTKNLARELAPHGIRVNAVAPGGVETPGVTGGRTSRELEEQLGAFAARVPLGRLGRPDEIATVTLVLVTGLSSYMTGSQVVVDGGALLA